ncbi:hypothetical protein [Bradyrhizobium sp. DASA03120]|uniref:hypothetical protein n=1 Tax=Bradyrhizobium sp. SMVTL-02 TaxID=3395917 RepID=UPI003F72D7A7
MKDQIEFQTRAEIAARGPLQLACSKVRLAPPQAADHRPLAVRPIPEFRTSFAPERREGNGTKATGIEQDRRKINEADQYSPAQQCCGVSEKFRLFALIDFADELYPRGVEQRRNGIAEAGLIGVVDLRGSRARRSTADRSQEMIPEELYRSRRQGLPGPWSVSRRVKLRGTGRGAAGR